MSMKHALLQSEGIIEDVKSKLSKKTAKVESLKEALDSLNRLALKPRSALKVQASNLKR